MSGNSIYFDDRKMSNLTIKERKSIFDKLTNSLNIKLIKGDKKIFSIWCTILIKVKTLKQNLLI